MENEKRTRLLAALLTLITVVGILPLSLFAASGTDDVTEVTAAERSYESVSAALASKSFTSHLYLDFENETAGPIAQSELSTVNSKGESTITPNSDGKTYSGGTVAVTKIQSPTGGTISVKNYKQALSVEEKNGNKAFYFGVAANTIYTNHNDNYFDVEHGDTSTRGNDLFLSVDFKMGGKNIVKSIDIESLLCFITRDKGKDSNGKDSEKHSTPTVWVSILTKPYPPKALLDFFPIPNIQAFRYT